MDKKKILNSIFLVLFTIAVILFTYNLFMSLRTGNQYIDITLNDEYSKETGITATLNIYDTSYNRRNSSASNTETLKSKVTMQLYDSNHKKVKNTKAKYDVEQGDTLDTKLDIPNDVDNGKYYLEFKVSSKKGTDKFEKVIEINNSNSNNLIISLDKGIYKPGDNVQFRGMLLSKADDTPIETDLNISIYDGNSNKVYNEDVKTSEYGITSGNFKLASEVNSGMYKLVFTVGNQEFSKQFKVNPYVTPKFDVKVSTDKDVYKLDETAKIKIDSKYFFGEPVKNADVEIAIGEEKVLGITNAEGIYEYELQSKENKVYNVKVAVTDESNYMIESSTTVSFSNTSFSIELLPEYGKIYKGLNNEVYVFTKTPDGKPIKTYTTISSGTISKQVITDENGIGSFSLTSSETRRISLDGFNIVSKNMNDETVSLVSKIEVGNQTGILIGTDKVKYTQGEDITIKLNSSYDITNQKIYICKDSKIIKSIKTDEEEFKINLENQYGLINIYTLNSNNKLENKRTIFIMPNKELKVNIETDKKEYEPSEELKLDVELNDKDGNKVDGALLVSILDEAILSLAQNDLTIDNLMISLNDISFDGDLDLASVYAILLDENNESTLMGMLLKQSQDVPSFQNDNYIGDNEEYKINAINFVILILVAVLIYFYIKSENIRILLKTVLIFVVWCFSVWFMGKFLEYEFLNTSYNLDIIYIAVAIFSYSLYISKDKEFAFRNLLEMIILPVLVFFIIMSLDVIDFDFSVYENRFFIITLTISILVFIFIMVKILKEIKNKKLKFSNELLKILYSFIIPIVLISESEYMILGNILGYIIVCLYNFVKVTKVNKKENKKILINLNISNLSAIIIIGLMFICFYIGLEYSKNDRIVYEERPVNGYFDTTISINNAGMNFNDLEMSANTFKGNDRSTTSKSTNNFSSLFSNINNNKSESSVKIEEDIKDNKIENTIIEDDNVRNIFLESLCFIPELKTENGKANQTIKLSDNITTWQIQTIANTKDGNVGYGTGSIKVFKEFFVDFSMPTNSVVGDKISIPVTVYNYTNNMLNVDLDIKTDNWFILGEFEKVVSVEANSTKMVYIPIEIIKDGENSLRIEGKSGQISDIIQLSMNTKPNGVKVSKVLSSGNFEDNIDLDVIFMQNSIENTRDLKVKLYPSTMTTIIEGLDNIFKMPTGCFEQTSSSLYPNIVALRYMKENDIINNELKNKALEYISSGYQRLLTFEVPSEKGGYSLYGKAPAETVLTAYGLMELKDLTTVYDVDENVINNMREFLFKKQNTNGTFKMQGNSSYSVSHVTGNKDEDTLNAYVIWALSESFPEDDRLKKSISYLEKNMDDITDNYTLALVANAFANTNNKNTDKIVKRLIKNVTNKNGNTYLNSSISDYWGSRGNTQNIQTTALTSLVLSKTSSNTKTNKALIESIISKRDVNGTWETTQATILSLKALNAYTSKNKIQEQDINVSLNTDIQTVHIEKNSLDLYEVDFENVDKENKLSLENEKGELYYEVVQEYYVTYDEFSKIKSDLTIQSKLDTEFLVNDKAIQRINIKNTTNTDIENGQVEITIPQGFSVSEESLSKLETLSLIEKYEYNYNSIYLYLRDFEVGKDIELEVEYKANYPETITGGMVRVYDYYNPEVEAYTMPVLINVK